MKDAGVGFAQLVGGGGRRRPRPDRRRDRRPHHRQSDRDGARYAVDCGQSSRSPCADAAADLRARLSLLPVPCVRRSHPDRRRGRRRPICAARHHRRRRDGRSLRQGRKDAVAALSRRTGGRTISGERRPQTLCLSAADARAAGCEFLAVGIEDRGSQRSQPPDAAGTAGRQRSLRQLSGCGAGIDGGPAAASACGCFTNNSARRARWSPPAASPPITPSAARCRMSPRERRPR